jgi:hypothetical protein
VKITVTTSTVTKVNTATNTTAPATVVDLAIALVLTTMMTGTTLRKTAKLRKRSQYLANTIVIMKVAASLMRASVGLSVALLLAKITQTALFGSKTTNSGLWMSVLLRSEFRM